MARHSRQALLNVEAAVEAVVGILVDVVALRIYIVNYRTEQAAIGSVLGEFSLRISALLVRGLE